MSAVVQLADVTVRRGNNVILNDLDWTVMDDERWVIVGPNGAGKTTLLQILAAQTFPTTGLVGILDEILGAVDVFDLRPRIGMCSSALAHRIPDEETVHDLIVSAAWAVLGRPGETYDPIDEARAD